MLKELNPRRRVYVEIPKPSRVQSYNVVKCSFDVILATPDGFGIST
jgi:hypothetical protein